MVTPSDHEDAHFKKEELAKLRAHRKAAEKALESQEKERLRKLHWMRCPKCGMELSEIQFKDVMVDTCFSCGGIYFDKGELEKVIDTEKPGVLGRITSTLFGA